MSEQVTMQRFGEKLRALRRQRGMTIIDLATALGYTANSYISELERGKKKPTADFVFKVAKLFNVTTDQLLDDALDVPGIAAEDAPDGDPRSE
jgi:transcriptional regulator with XRE-family HTH domain